MAPSRTFWKGDEVKKKKHHRNRRGWTKAAWLKFKAEAIGTNRRIITWVNTRATVARMDERED